MRFPGYVLAGEARVWTLIFLGEDAPSAVLVVADFNVYALNARTGPSHVITSPAAWCVPPRHWPADTGASAS